MFPSFLLIIRLSCHRFGGVPFKNIARYSIGLAVAGLLLWWVLRGSNPELLWEQLAQTSLVGLGAAVVLNIGQNVFRVWRWRALLEPVRAGVPFRPMFSSVILGYMTSWIVPGRVGELVRPLVLSGQTDVPLGPCLGTIVADRLLDATTVVALFAVGSWMLPLEGPVAEYAGVVRGGALVAAFFVVAAMGAMLLASGNSERLSAVLARRGPLLAWLGRMALSLSHGVSALRSPRLTLWIVFHSLMTWLTISLSTWCGVRAVGAAVSLPEIFFIMPLLVLGVAVPTPGGAGSYHGLMKVGLMWFGVAELTAVSAGLLVHAAITVPVILLGTVLLWTEGISFRHLMDGAKQIRRLGELPPAAPVDRVAEGVS